jgi:hypothetical protein
MLELAQGRYVARMDADDIALKDRFQAQLQAFANTDASVVGTWARRFGAADYLHTPPTEHDAILAALGISSPFVNPTVMYDRDRLGALPQFDPNVEFGGDYAHFAALRRIAKFHNIPEVHLLWRKHDRNVGTDPETMRRQHRTVSRIRSEIWSDSGIQLTVDEESALDRFVFLPLPLASESHSLLSAFGKALDPSHSESLWAPPEVVKQMLLEHWNYYCSVQAWGKPSSIRMWLKGCKALGGTPTPYMLAKIGVKAILRRPGFQAPNFSFTAKKSGILRN